MKFSHATFAASSAAALVLSAGAAFAQQPAAAAAAAPASPPPAALPGICAFSHDGAVAGSKLGQYIKQRMDTITKQTQAELQSTGESLQNDAKATDAQRPTMSQEAFEQKALEIRQRGDAFQRLQQVREREVQMTAGKALQRFDTEANPLFEMSVRERGCAIVMDADNTYYISPTMDITPAVVAKLDSKISEFAFDRERLDQQLAAQGGAAPAAGPAASRPVANPTAVAPRPASTPARRPAGK
jgi:outer membrane protein